MKKQFIQNGLGYEAPSVEVVAVVEQGVICNSALVDDYTNSDDNFDMFSNY